MAVPRKHPSKDAGARTTGSLWRDDRIPVVDDTLPEDLDHLDVVVVGAGLTGLTTASLLAQAGRQVVVLEAREVGAVTTGHSTAKVSALQGTHLSLVRKHHGANVAAAYVEAQREGAAWLLRHCEEHDVAVQRRPAITFAASQREIPAVEREHRAAREAGLPVSLHATLDAPFPVHRAVSLVDQAQVHPGHLLRSLVDRFRADGGRLRQGVRVRSASLLPGGERVRLDLDDGTELRAREVVLATGTPVLDRGLHFARLEPQRSYVVVAQPSAAVPAPEGMFLSAGSDSRSVRDVPRADGDALLMVGGAGHTVGRGSGEAQHLDRLRRWLGEQFPGAVETHAWSAQDYASYDAMPIVGPLPGGRIRVATGYQKWGFTNAVAAALTLSADLLDGRRPSWAAGLWSRRMPTLVDAGGVVRINAGVGLATARGVARAVTRRDTPLCTHLGGVLRWNDAEGSWDCPLHGSRFGAAGEVLEGPATRPLRGCPMAGGGPA